jgi:hypothetical protein
MGKTRYKNKIQATVTALVTVGFSFDDELERVHPSPVRKGC